MKDFIFHNPTKIVFGENSSDKIGFFAKNMGKKALLVYGQNSIKKSGLYDKVIADLKANDIGFVEHGGIKSNPTLTHAREGVLKVQENNIDFIIAIGGGSVIDEGKAIAASAAMGVDVWSFFTQEVAIDKALPILAVLTMPATGTEMNGNMVITNTETSDKFGLGNSCLYPQVSILDPILTHSIPLKTTVHSAVDVVSHLTESYFNNAGGWTILQERYVEGMVKTVIDATSRILQNSQDSDARSTFMWAATMGWNGLNVAGIGAFSMPCHTLEHPVSALYDISHGAGLSILTPQWMMMELENKEAKFARFAYEVFGVSLPSQKEQAIAGVEALKSWYKEIGAPLTFADAGILNPDVAKLTELTLKASKLKNMKEFNDSYVSKIFSTSI